MNINLCPRVAGIFDRSKVSLSYVHIAAIEIIDAKIIDAAVFIYRTSKSSHTCPRARHRLWVEGRMAMTAATGGGSGVRSDGLFDSIQFISIGDEEEPIEWVSDCWVMVEKTGFI